MSRTAEQHIQQETNCPYGKRPLFAHAFLETLHGLTLVSIWESSSVMRNLQGRLLRLDHVDSEGDTPLLLVAATPSLRALRPG